MIRKNEGLTVIKLLIITIIILVCLALLNYYGVFIKISEKADILYKTITRQINIEEEIRENEKLIGTTDVEGQGITISILDGKDLIHQEDLIILIDELKNAGSQAISINEQRIATNTYLYCDGSVILIDGFKIGNPFIIKAIGDPSTLESTLLGNGGYIETLKKERI